MTRPVDPAPLASSPSLAAEAPVRRARLGTGRSRGAPVLFEPASTCAAPDPTLFRVTVTGDAWLAYRCALLRQLCEALQVDYAALADVSCERAVGPVRPLTAVGTAGLSMGPAGFHLSSIAPAGARQGLPTAIIRSGAAS